MRAAMRYRLVEILEYGWDLSVRCEACGERVRRSKDHFLGPWRKYLNAPVDALAERLKCPCGAQASRADIAGATYAHFGMAGQIERGRALWIRSALTEAGLDPALYGYPPLADTGNEKGPARGSGGAS